MWQPIYNSLLGRFSGERAFAQAYEQNRLERFFTFPNFERSAQRCAAQLQSAGLEEVQVEDFPADGKTAWSGWRAMKAWDVESARLLMVTPRQELLSDWRIKPASLVMYSGPGAVEAEVVEWNGETDADLTGKIPFTRQRINDVYPQMKRLGVSGILSDFIGILPGVRDSSDLFDEVRWENSGLRPAQGAAWGFMLTPRQGAMLRELLRQGSVRVLVEIKSRVYDGLFKSATGIIRGAEIPEEEILFSSHLYEPGANDNASGVGVGLELAHILNEAISAGILPRPRRSIRFLFNWEGCGLIAWFEKHGNRRILGGINIDEIGVDQVKGHSVAHLFMPPASNASCIGDLARYLCGQILSPQVRWKAVADRADIINDTITSDPHIDTVMPCLIQYPSRFYHSSGDVPETLSPEVMERFGLLSGTHLYFLANAGPREAAYLARLLLDNCREKLGESEARLRAGNWPFDKQRSQKWFREQFQVKASSLNKFGFAGEEREALEQTLTEILEEWSRRMESFFPKRELRQADESLLKRARALILNRTTLGAPKAWESLALSAEEEQEYRRILYGNNLDLLFHRLCYEETAIARTSSGTLVEKKEATQIALDAIFYLVGLLIKNGYLAAE
ncbi:MAG: DUF4910 domain-containing protein [Candidatus Omnitrophica bacterium]|nr:DUF4910 domain-containing protein [Candidatus Omnitrophota bacterium]